MADERAWGAVTERSTMVQTYESPPQQIADTPLGRGWKRQCEHCDYWQVDVNGPVRSGIHYCQRSEVLYLVSWTS